MSEEKPQKPMSIEQAGNYLKEKRKTLPEDIKKEAKNAPISFASPEDRQAYLMYGISLLNNVSESTKNNWCLIAGKAPAMYTTREVAGILHKFLTLRINGYSIKQIAYHLNTTVFILEQVEKLAITAIAEAIVKKKNTEIPLIGG